VALCTTGALRRQAWYYLQFVKLALSRDEKEWLGMVSLAVQFIRALGYTHRTNEDSDDPGSRIEFS
jgi:hypothetical protein